MSTLTVPVKFGEGAVSPTYATDGAAGMDLVSTAEVLLPHGVCQAVPTGVFLAIPDGFEAQVRPRSGLAVKYGVTVMNAPGTIDSDYRGEVKVLLINHRDQPFIISPGDRIAQLVFAPVTRVALQPVEELPDTARGAGGFGSTGR